MTALHPIIGATGSSGAGTSIARRAFKQMFHQLGLHPALVEGDAFHAYDRAGTTAAIERARIRGEHFSLLGPSGNLLGRLDRLLREYGERGTGLTRRYLHTETEARHGRQPVGSFTPWEPLPSGTDLLFYEGLFGGYVGEDADIARHMDLLVGIVPIVNLEWIQKLKRDTGKRGYRPEDVTRTILRRMPDYVNHITPQFSRTDVNFQRVPLVDTSNPFVVRQVPTQQESLVVIHFNGHTRLDPDLDRCLARVPGAFKSNPQTLVVPGPQVPRAVDVILRPAIEKLVGQRRVLLASPRPMLEPGVGASGLAS